jgi:hypothetical protein
MFQRITVSSLLLFGVFGLFWFYFTCCIQQSDVQEYAHHKITQEKPSSQSLSSAIYQTRQGVCKDIWVVQDDGTRLQTRIESDSSILTLHPQGTSGNRYEIVEDLHKIRFWMQDRLFAAQGGVPTQQMRYLEADTGTYLYSTQQFLAQTVTLSLYRLPGHVLNLKQDINSAFIKGIAQDVSFSVSGKESQFQAKNFKAQFSKNIGSL